MGNNFLGTGVKFPITVDNNTIEMAEGEISISEAIFLILGTAKGERVMKPDFGCRLQELVFASNNTSTATLATYYVTKSLQKWEPRIVLENVNVTPDTDDHNMLNINIDYKIIATNTKRNLVYPFYLEKGQ